MIVNHYYDHFEHDHLKHDEMLVNHHYNLLDVCHIQYLWVEIYLMFFFSKLQLIRGLISCRHGNICIVLSIVYAGSGVDCVSSIILLMFGVNIIYNLKKKYLLFVMFFY
jgi:hypothetical protein